MYLYIPSYIPQNATRGITVVILTFLRSFDRKYKKVKKISGILRRVSVQSPEVLILVNNIYNK